MLLSSTKVEDTIVHIRKRRGIPVIREHYLRDDIPCRIQYCNLCDQSLSDIHCMLTKDLTHFIIPDTFVIEKFYEVLEHPQLKGIIISQTTCKHLKTIIGKRLFARFMKSMSVPLKNCIHFSNEHQLQCYSSRTVHQTLSDWQRKLISDMVIWYSHHLEMIGANNVSLILLTENTSEYSFPNHPCVKVLSLRDYLDTYFNQKKGDDNTNLFQLYDSITAASLSMKDTPTTVGHSKDASSYTEYIAIDKLRKEIQLGHLIEGKLRVNRYHPREEAFVTPTNSMIESDVLNRPLYKDILISGSINRNRAIHGDTVAVQLLPQSEWKGTSKHISHSTDDKKSHDESRDLEVRPTGKVVGIILRSCRDIVASFPDEVIKSERMERILVTPYDIRIPKIRINTRLATQLSNHRIVIRIDDWNINYQYPNGHFVRSIGPVGDIETETQAILIEHELSRGSFTQSILSELPSEENWSMNEEEISCRKDLRFSRLIFSIDPQGCEDVDDTLSVRQLDNGFIELGVHIADVSYFVKPDSYTDREAKGRSVTVYLADRRYDMLPGVLSANLCSLLSNVDRYAVSVIWTLYPNYEVKDVWYGRTVIRSSYKLTYEVAQDLFEDKSHEKEELLKLIPELRHVPVNDIQHKVGELRWAVKQLVDISRVLREKRNKQGALELEGVEVKIQLKDKQDIQDILPKQALEMHETVAECMIFANHWVAKKIYQHFPSYALLRNHSCPQSDQFEQLHLCASVRHFSIDTSSNRSLAQSLDRAIDHKDNNVNKVLRMLTTRAMVQALYISTGSTNSNSDMTHYGLGLDQYTHFTSPIRRYADLIVHRQLLAAVKGELHPHDIPTNSQLMDTCSHMNEKNRAAKRAQSDSTSLFQALYFLKSSPGDSRGITDAIVYSIRANGIMAYVPRYGIQGPVYLQNKKGLVLCEYKNTLSWNEGSVSFTDQSIIISSLYGSSYTISLLDHITVNITVDQTNSAHPLTLSMELVSHRTVTIPDVGELKQNKLQLIQTVRSENDSQSVKEELDYCTEYCQQKNSLYELIEQMHTIGLQDT